MAPVDVIGRAEQLVRSEEERRRVLASCGDHVVGGILQPGPQAAGEPGIEAGASGGSGRTLLATNLAVAFAKNRRRV